MNTLFCVGKIKICGYTFERFNEKNVNKILDFLYTLDISDVCFESYIPMYIDNNNVYYKIINRCLCIFVYFNKQITLITFPIGNNHNDKKIAFRKCIKMMYSINNNEYDVNIDVLDEYFLSFFDRSKINTINNYCEEFVYLTQELIDMEGRKYKHIRHAINKFEKNKFICREYVDDDFSQISTLYKLWSDNYNKKKKENKGYGEKNGVNDTETFFKYIKYRHLFGIKIYVIYDADTMIGCIAIARLCKNSSIILFEKCDNSYLGICEYLWKEAVDRFDFYKYECDGDGGTKLKDGSHITGLYDYKMKFNPVYIREIYSVVVAKKNQIITDDFFKN